jgi:hypothetical protein
MKIIERGYTKKVVWRSIRGKAVEHWHFPWVIFGFTIGNFTITQEDKREAN